MSKPVFKPNVLDRLVSYFAPVHGLKRTQARAWGDMINGSGYAGADRFKRSLRNWQPLAGSPDRDTNFDLLMLRARSRDAARNQPLAAGTINSNVTSVVGTGLTVKPAINAEYLGMSDEDAEKWNRNTRREFESWALSPIHYDMEGGCNFYEHQALAFRSTLESGDIAALLPMVARTGGTYETKVQLIEADRICNENYQADVPGGWQQGVLTDDFGLPTQYAIAKFHPGDYRPDQTWTKVNAFGTKTGRRNLIHLFEKTRPGLRRGVPYLAPVLDSLRQLDQYSEAELRAALISGMFTVFIERATAADPTTGGDSFLGDGVDGGDLELGYGAVAELNPGEKANMANPGRPNAQFDPFVKAVLTQVGVALEIPLEVLVKHFSSSYSASRAALLEAWRFFKKRRSWLTTRFCQPVYETWLEEAIAIGRISAPGFFRDSSIRHAYCNAEWMGDGPGSIDPLKEANAIIKRIEIGVSNREKECMALDGSDWRNTAVQLGKETALLKELGVNPDPEPNIGSGPGTSGTGSQ